VQVTFLLALFFLNFLSASIFSDIKVFIIIIIIIIIIRLFLKSCGLSQGVSPTQLSLISSFNNFSAAVLYGRLNLTSCLDRVSPSIGSVF